MKRRIETGNLHGVWKGTARGRDAGEIVRLVNRRQRYEAFKFRDDVTGEFDGLRKARAAMDDTVPDGRDLRFRKVRLECVQDMLQRLVMRVRSVFWNEPVLEFIARAGTQDQMRRRSKRLDLPPRVRNRLPAIHIKQREFQR